MRNYIPMIRGTYVTTNRNPAYFCDYERKQSFGGS